MGDKDPQTNVNLQDDELARRREAAAEAIPSGTAVVPATEEPGAVPHSGKGGLEKPVEEFDNTTLSDAVAQGRVRPIPNSPAVLTPETRGTKSHKTRNRVVGGVAAVAVIAGGVGALELSGGKSSHKPAAISSKNPGETNAPTQSQPNTTKPSPTDITLPNSVKTTPARTGETGIMINGNEFSAGKLDPTVPIAVPFAEGQEITKGDVEKLFHNIDVAITTQNVDTLLYSGIYPDSEYTQNIQAEGGEWWAFQTEKANNSALVHTYNHTFYDKDISIDQATGEVHVIAELGTEFDKMSGQLNYSEYDVTVGAQEVTLPNGQTKNILAFKTLPAPTPTTGSAWNYGFQS